MDPIQPSQPTPQQPSNQNTPDTSNTELWGRTRLGIFVLGIIALTLFGRYYGTKNHIDAVPGQAIKIEASQRIGLVGHKVPLLSNTNIFHKTKSFKKILKYVPPEGEITITPKDPTKSIDDLITIHYKEIGWTFEPGVEISGNIYYAYGVDAKIFYAYRFGTGFGIVVGSNVPTILSPDIFISYRLDQIHIRNTEAIITYTPLGKIPLGLGLRINL